MSTASSLLFGNVSFFCPGDAGGGGRSGGGGIAATTTATTPTTTATTATALTPTTTQTTPTTTQTTPTTTQSPTQTPTAEAVHLLVRYGARQVTSIHQATHVVTERRFGGGTVGGGGGGTRTATTTTRTATTTTRTATTIPWSGTGTPPPPAPSAPVPVHPNWVVHSVRVGRLLATDDYAMDRPRLVLAGMVFSWPGLVFDHEDDHDDDEDDRDDHDRDKDHGQDQDHVSAATARPASHPPPASRPPRCDFSTVDQELLVASIEYLGGLVVADVRDPRVDHVLALREEGEGVDEDEDEVATTTTEKEAATAATSTATTVNPFLAPFPTPRTTPVVVRLLPHYVEDCLTVGARMPYDDYRFPRPPLLHPGRFQTTTMTTTTTTTAVTAATTAATTTALLPPGCGGAEATPFLAGKRFHVDPGYPMEPARLQMYMDYLTRAGGQLVANYASGVASTSAGASTSASTGERATIDYVLVQCQSSDVYRKVRAVVGGG